MLNFVWEVIFNNLITDEANDYGESLSNEADFLGDDLYIYLILEWNLNPESEIWGGQNRKTKLLLLKHSQSLKQERDKRSINCGGHDTLANFCNKKWAILPSKDHPFRANFL